MASDLGLLDVLGAAKAGSAQKQILAAMDERKEGILSAFRRAVPFLIRKSVPLTMTAARFSSSRELREEVPGPTFVVPLVTDPGGSRALLMFDPGAIGFLQNGVLGGQPDQLDIPKELTATQRAVLSGIADDVVKRLSEAFAPAGFGLRRLPSASSVPADAQLACVSVQIGDPERRVIFGVAREALQSVTSGHVRSSRSAGGVSRVPEILGNAELEIVAELGRLRRTLADLEALRVGDTLRLDTAVTAPISLHVQGQLISRGQPTTRGTRLAILVTEQAQPQAPAAEPALPGQVVTAELVASAG